MTHNDILVIFKGLFPFEPIKMWWKKGKNIIRVRRGEASGSDVFFTYNNPGSWKLETKSMYEASTDGI